MRGIGKEAVLIAAKKRDILEISYRLFIQKGIENVSIQEIADNSAYGVASVYRYFKNKVTIVVEAAACKWKDFLEENREKRPADFDSQSAAENFDYYLESFIRLYKEHKDLLKFNQYFNVYIYAKETDTESLKPYREVIMNLKDMFHAIYEKGLSDHSLKCETAEDEMFSVTLHLMLAAVTRYAVGLAYVPAGFDACAELEKQKEALKYLYVAK